MLQNVLPGVKKEFKIYSTVCSQYDWVPTELTLQERIIIKSGKIQKINKCLKSQRSKENRKILEENWHLEEGSVTE